MYRTSYYKTIFLVTGFVFFFSIFLPLVVQAESPAIPNKKPVILLIDGMCPNATGSTVIDLHTFFKLLSLGTIEINHDTCWTNYLKEAFSPELPEYLVASFQWTGEINKTKEHLKSAEKSIRNYYDVAKQRGTTFEIIAHSWGSVLSYIVLKQNPDIKVDTFITLGSPLRSNLVEARQYTEKYTGANIEKPNNVKKWVNYWAWNDLISGAIKVADKNFQIDEVATGTDDETRMVATKDFHSKYYTEWKSSIISDLASISKYQNIEGLPLSLTIPYEDNGACPFEGCIYREWLAIRDTLIKKERKKESPVVFTVKKGEKVIAETGVVITIVPGEIEVLKDTHLSDDNVPYRDKGVSYSFHKGDRLYLLTYLGEGFWKTWYKGKFLEISFPVITQPGAEVMREESKDFRLIRVNQSIWWVKIKNKAGKVGWTDQPGNFDNKDMFGGTYQDNQTSTVSQNNNGQGNTEPIKKSTNTPTVNSVINETIQRIGNTILQGLNPGSEQSTQPSTPIDPNQTQTDEGRRQKPGRW